MTQTETQTEKPVFHLPDPRHSDKMPPGTYLNRELSWLEFNNRVLAEAQNAKNPPLERLKYCAITGSNLDEFFMVRVAGLHRQIAAGVATPSPDGLTPAANLELVREYTHRTMSEAQEAVSDIVALLRQKGLMMAEFDDLSPLERQHLREHYLAEIGPVLTPLAVDPSHPFPFVSNLSLNIGVILEEDDEDEFARVKIPVGVLPRVVKLPSGQFMLLEEIIAAHLNELFRGRKVKNHFVFRVTRNTDYEFDEDEAEDLLATIEDGLKRRRFGSVVRLEVEEKLDPAVLEDLCSRLNVQPADVYPQNGILGLSDLMSLTGLNPELSFPAFQASVPDLAQDSGDIFQTLRNQDILLHHPYQSFEGVLQFLEAAARDPQVLTIKQTLYRTGGDKRLLNALLTASESGKQVLALVELKARFDEQRNITWAKTLERSGIHVVYGMANLKTHAKVTLVVRREPGGLRRYVHVGTGNYNPRTAALYTDLSLLTSDPQIGHDAGELFNHLTGYASADYPTLIVAPEAMRERFFKLLEREIEHAQHGKSGLVLAKMNSLTDPQMINMLYRASSAGVKIQLVVRGVCCLRPGVAGLSENIRVRSLVGRFLEHARICYFENDGDPEAYIGSADWMARNLNRRVEVAAPVRKAKHQRYLKDLLLQEWADTRGSWELLEDGSYQKVKGRWFSAQRHFMLKHGHIAEDVKE